MQQADRAALKADARDMLATLQQQLEHAGASALEAGEERDALQTLLKVRTRRCVRQNRPGILQR